MCLYSPRDTNTIKTWFKKRETSHINAQVPNGDGSAFRSSLLSHTPPHVAGHGVHLPAMGSECSCINTLLVSFRKGGTREMLSESNVIWWHRLVLKLKLCCYLSNFVCTRLSRRYLFYETRLRFL